MIGPSRNRAKLRLSFNLLMKTSVVKCSFCPQTGANIFIAERFSTKKSKTFLAFFPSFIIF